MLRHAVPFLLVAFGQLVCAKTLSCDYLRDTDAMKMGHVTANFEESMDRSIQAISSYQHWSQGDNRLIPTNHFEDYKSEITSLREDPKKDLLFALDNAEVYEIVKMHYDLVNDEFVGIRNARWKNLEFERDYISIAICKFN